MRIRLSRCAAILLGLSAACLAAVPDPAVVQGLYEGSRKSAAGEQKLEARVVALGKGTCKALIRVPAADGKITKIQLAGATASDAITFSGKAGDAQWTGAYADGAIKGSCGNDSTFEMKRIVRNSPTLGAKPPQGAVVLLDGKNFSELVIRSEKPTTQPEWKIVEEGAVEVPRGGMTSKRTFPGSFNAHVEFQCPLRPEATGQGRGNSGVYLPNGDEIQILDSFGMDTYLGGGCGGLYRYKDPDAFDVFSLASAPPLQWQTYDIEYRVTDDGGKKVVKVTVLHNGIKIHDNATLKNGPKNGSFYFQDHGNPVIYRNIWVQEVK